MAMNFNDLIGPRTRAGSIHSFANFKKVPVEVILEEAQSLIYGLLRVREMRVSATITLSAAASSVNLPARFLEAVAMRDREGWETIPDRYVEPPALLAQRTYTSDVLDTGTPMDVAIFDEAFQFACKAETQRKYDLVYYESKALLSASNSTNFLTSRYPKLLRVACQAGAASFMKDSAEFRERIEELAALATAANAESDLGRAA